MIYTTFYLFIYGYLHTFHVLAILNKERCNEHGVLIYIHTALISYFCFFWVYSQKQDCWIIGCSFLNFYEETPYCFSYWLSNLQSYWQCTMVRFFFFFFCSGFCHTLKWNSHGFTCVPHPDPHSHLPLLPIPLGLPSAPGPSACLMHPTWAADLFHPR